METEERDHQTQENNLSFDIDHKRKFKEVVDQFSEMIQFLDFTFERAFDSKEKEFMLAYKVNH